MIAMRSSTGRWVSGEDFSMAAKRRPWRGCVSVTAMVSCKSAAAMRYNIGDTLIKDTCNE